MADWIALGLDVGFGLICYAVYKYKHNYLKSVETAEEITLDNELFNRVVNKGRTVNYACVSGTVGTDCTPLRSQYAEDVRGVIKRLTHIEHRDKRIDGKWYQSAQRLGSPLIDRIQFHLSDPERSSVKVHVLDAEGADYIMSELTRTHSTISAPEKSLSSKLFDIFFSSDVSKGIETTEEMLTVGSRLYGLGRITAHQGCLVFDTPENGAPFVLTTRTLKQLINSLRRHIRIARGFLYFFGSSGALIMAYIVYRKYKIWRDSSMFRNVRRQLQDQRRNNRNGGVVPQPARREERPNDDNGQPGQECVICLTNQRNVVLLECGHLCICIDCSEALPFPRKCPICRNLISRVMPVFNS